MQVEGLWRGLLKTFIEFKFLGRVLNCWCIYKSLHFPVAPHPFPFGGGSGWRGGGGKATGQTIMRLICRENVCPVNRWRNYWVYQRTCCTFIGNHLHRPIIIANLAIQQHFPIQILLVFLRFKLLPIIFHCYRPQTWQFYLFFPALSISAIHKVLGIKFKGGRSREP